MKTKADYRRELVQAAASAAVRIMDSDRSGLRWPVVATLDLLQRAWMAGHNAAKQEKK